MALWIKNFSVYGKRKLQMAARRDGLEIGREQTARIMGQLGIRGASRAKKRFTTRSDPAAPRSPDLMGRDFTATRPNEKWVADFERHEALLNPAVMKGHRLRLVAAGR